MRIGGGEARGRRLKGAVIPGARPTTERVRAAIFNILDPDQYLDKRVLDLFAGTGSLGIEALSRGAAWADFVERDRRQCAVIRENLATAGYEEHSSVRQGDATGSLSSLGGRYSLVLLDPPYRMGAFHQVMDAISLRAELVVSGGMVVAGHSRRTELRAAYGSLRLAIFRQYGDNAVSFYINDPGDAPENAGEHSGNAHPAGTQPEGTLEQSW